MPNPIKYSTGAESLALKKGNFYIGTGDVGKGPSDTTGYYQGPNIPTDGYVIYLNNPGQPGDLSYHTANNDSELISFTNELAGASYTTVNECLTYFAGQSDKVCVNKDYEGIVTDGLVLNLDAGFIPSYPTTGSTWYNVSNTGSNNGTLTNGPTYSTDGSGSIVFDGVDDLITTTLTSNTIFNSPFTVSCWFNADAIESFPRIFNKANDGSTFEVGGFGSFFNDSNGTYQIYCRIDNNLINTSAATFSLGVWNNLTTVFKNGEATVYLNGGSGITGTNASAQLSDITTSDDFVIGNVHGANRPFDGKIAIIMIYSKEISQAENTQNYNSLKSRFGI